MEWIHCSRNTLADSLSHLLEVLLEADKKKEIEGQEFGCYCFDDLKPVHTEYIEEIGEMKLCESENVMNKIFVMEDGVFYHLWLEHAKLSNAFWFQRYFVMHY